MEYRKTPKNLDTRQISVLILKFKHCGSTRVSCVQKDADGIANSVDPDQTVCQHLSVRKLRIITVVLFDSDWLGLIS